MLFVGGDFHRKGGNLLLEFMRSPSRPRCELHLVTQSAVTPQPDVFVHRGLMANSPELLALFRDADIFVLPTRADCLGVALMEAAATGLPSIATNVGGVPEAVRDGETGFVIPSGDSKALYNSLLTLLTNTDQRYRMGRAAFAVASDRFDAQRNNRRLLDFVLECSQADSTRAA
jgi:glycosyltransferase involved in cell wall biosynthesis